MLENEYLGNEIIVNNEYTIRVSNVYGNTMMLEFEDCQDKCSTQISFHIDDIHIVEKLYDEIGTVLNLMKKENKKRERI